MRIAFVIPSLAVGGAERVSISLANMLCSRGHEVSIITFWSSGLLQDVLHPDVNAISLDVKRSYTAPDAVANAWMHLNPQIVISTLNTTNAVCCRAKLKHHLQAPLICAVHARLYGSVNSLSVIRQRIWAHLTRVNVKAADVITTPSDGVTAEAIRYFGDVDVRTMPNAVIPRADPFSQKIERDRKQLLWLGRLTPPKNPQLVMSAFALYAQQHDWRLQIAGDGPMRGYLLNLASKMGIADRVSMLGEVSDPSELLKRAGCLMFASFSEALPTVLIEAMQCGTPVVATDTPCGVRDLLTGAKYGHIVPLRDPKAMSEAAVLALASTPEVPVEYLRRYEPVNACIRYEELCQEVIDKRKASEA